MTEITFQNDKTGALERAHGSDGRLNVSSRSDTHGYYISRAQAQSYSLVCDHTNAAVGEYSMYLQNTSTTGLDLVVSSIGINSTTAAIFKLWFVTGVAGDGATITPTNLNKSSSNDAAATALESAAGTSISNLTTDGIIDVASLSAGAHEELRLGDRLRLGQNDAIAIEFENASGTEEGFGVCFFYYE